MVYYPNINPIAIQIGQLKIYWYGIMYLIGFASAWLLCNLRAQRPDINMTREQVSDLIFYAALGTIIGGRVGYMLFYGWHDLISKPVSLFYVWHGGMSFHGGLIGVAISLIWFAHRNQRSFFQVSDFLVPMAPIGLGAGRIGNFINGELWGRVTDVPWGMVYPNAGVLPRHPSELYEFLLEGVVLFIILWFYSRKPRPRMMVSGLFLVLYGIFRFTCEFFREPDQQIGFVAFDWMTKGQLLCIPMVLVGVGFLVWGKRKSSINQC